jgi:hypothetical protein
MYCFRGMREHSCLFAHLDWDSQGGRPGVEMMPPSRHRNPLTEAGSEGGCRSLFGGMRERQWLAAAFEPGPAF